MDLERPTWRLRCIGAGLMLGCALLLSACGRQETVEAASRNAARPDPLLGQWVMIEDNGGGGKGTVADFRPDGTVVVTQKGKRVVGRYKREPGTAWLDRRTAALGMPRTGSVMDVVRKPGVEMVEFADEHGQYRDYGGTLLTLDPDRRVLYNILTALWCRPGEEGRVKEELRDRSAPGAGDGETQGQGDGGMVG